MALQTKGFLNTRQLNRKFSKHGADFGASNAEEYERFADDFLGSSARSGVHECGRPQGDKVRYDPQTDAYGVLDAAGVIRTYYKPVPCSSILNPLIRAASQQAGMCHRHASNLLYFQWECRRIYGN
jgi:pyocin large subunit-like protein